LSSIRIEPLQRSHNREDFDCGQLSLNRFLQAVARQHDERNLGRTFVAVEEGSPKVLGYYTLASGRITFENLPDKRKLPHMPIPVVLLGRLAVDNRQQGRGLGKLLLMHALWRAGRIAREAGVFAVEVDAIDDSAAAFYQRYGFTPLLDDPRHLYLSMKDVEALGLDFAAPEG
jgi:GNAT superfamily N-acetyltransferase